MVKVGKNKQKKRRGASLTVLALFLLTTAGVILQLTPLSLQGIGSFTQTVVGKIPPPAAFNTSDTSKTTMRGSVYDRNFKELGISYHLYNLYVKTAEIKDHQDIAKQLSTVLNKDIKSLATFIKQPQHIISISENLEKKIADQINEMHLDGVYCKAIEKRFYPEHFTAAHLVGFSKNNTGLAGAEKKFDTILQPGVFRNSDFPQLNLNKKEVIGQKSADIILSVDLTIQKTLDNLLEKYLQNFKTIKAIALVMDPRTGEILSLTSSPAYNPNFFWQATSKQKDNTASDFIDLELVKPIIARAATIIKENGRTDLSLPKFATAPLHGLSEIEIKSYASKMGFYNNNKSELSANLDIIQSQDENQKNDGTLLNSIQVATTIATLINGGWNIVPYYLNSIYDHASNTFYYRNQPLASAKEPRSISPTMGVRIRRGLAEFSQNKKDNFLIYYQKLNKVNVNPNKSTYTMQEFVLGWAPKKIPDKLLLLAIQHADLYPLPLQRKNTKLSLQETAKNILQFLKDHKNVATSSRYPQAKDPYNYQQFLISQKIDTNEPLQATSQSPFTMPDVTGLSLRKALKLLNKSNLKIRIQGNGRIVEQAPAVGESLESFTSCTLTLEQKY